MSRANEAEKSTWHLQWPYIGLAQVVHRIAPLYTEI